MSKTNLDKFRADMKEKIESLLIEEKPSTLNMNSPYIIKDLMDLHKKLLTLTKQNLYKLRQAADKKSLTVSMNSTRENLTGSFNELSTFIEKCICELRQTGYSDVSFCDQKELIILIDELAMNIDGLNGLYIEGDNRFSDISDIVEVNLLRDNLEKQTTPTKAKCKAIL